LHLRSRKPILTLAVTYEQTLAALADPTRRAILEMLREPMSVTDIAEQLPVSRPAVSQHLAVLREASLVTERREGTKRIYSADPEGLAALREYLERYWGGVLERYAAAARKESKRRKK
jgi:DNA-binding transcriptional ArsR family regulator